MRCTETFWSPCIKQIRLAFKGQSRTIRLQRSHDSTQSCVCEHIMGLVKGKLHLGSVFETADVQVTHSVLSHRSGTCPQWRTERHLQHSKCSSRRGYIFALGEAAKLCKAAITFVTSVRPHGTTGLPPEGFSWNLIFKYFLEKSAEKIQFSLKSEKNNEYMKIYVHLL
jgi:hypothetical protein